MTTLTPFSVYVTAKWRPFEDGENFNLRGRMSGKKTCEKESDPAPFSIFVHRMHIYARALRGALRFVLPAFLLLASTRVHADHPVATSGAPQCVDSGNVNLISGSCRGSEGIVLRGAAAASPATAVMPWVVDLSSSLFSAFSRSEPFPHDSAVLLKRTASAWIRRVHRNNLLRESIIRDNSVGYIDYDFELLQSDVPPLLPPVRSSSGLQSYVSHAPFDNFGNGNDSFFGLQNILKVKLTFYTDSK